MLRAGTRSMKQTLALFMLTPTQRNPQNGASGGPGDEVQLLTQPCSLQPLRFRQRGGGVMIDGVAGSEPSFIAYTAYFTPPVVPVGSALVTRVDGVFYPVLKQGYGQDVGGAGGMIQLELGAAEANR